MTNYKTLDVWSVPMQLVKKNYDLTQGFPKEEKYGLTSQIKRAAVSIPANIAEGTGRQYRKETIQFLHISRGSAYELETLLSIAMMVDIISENDLDTISPFMEKTLKVLNGYINYMEKANLK